MTANARRAAAGLLLLAVLGTVVSASNVAPTSHAALAPPSGAGLPAPTRSIGIRVSGKSYSTQRLAPADTLIPAGPVGESMLRGRAMLWATRDSLPHNVGNALRCVSCHLDGGTRASSGPWVGVAASFPQYNARAGRVIVLADRINECLRRSMNGTPLPVDSHDMRDLESAFAHLSNGVPEGTKSEWLGLRKLEPRPADAGAGEALFAAKCVRCHGATGQGTPPYPPLWGARSFAIGAGLARLNTLAAFVRWNMPFDQPGTLSDQQAFDVAAFVLTHARPDTPGKERDWPKGDAPPDCPYRSALLSSRVTR
jgi:thiosulfate dehydrogenase